MHSLARHLPIVQSDTLIRKLQLSDLSRFHAYRSDADLATYQGWSAMSLEAARSFIEEMAAVPALRPGHWVQLAIADAASDQLLGDLGLYLEPDRSAGELGFTLCREAQGRGHAGRAVHAALALFFAASAVPLVRAVTDARNLNSIRVLQRAAFARSSSQEAIFKGEPCTELVYVCHRPGA